MLCMLSAHGQGGEFGVPDCTDHHGEGSGAPHAIQAPRRDISGRAEIGTMCWGMLGAWSTPVLPAHGRGPLEGRWPMARPFWLELDQESPRLCMFHQSRTL